MRVIPFIILLVVLQGHARDVLAQSYYNQQPDFLNANRFWAIAVQSGLDFNSGSPMAQKTALGSLEGVASVADPISGSLLFYSDGSKCWNRNHRVMPNGGSILGNKGSTTQGTCIVPLVDSPGKYYLFSLRGAQDFAPHTFPTLFYSIVDMRLDNGLGDIIPSEKNIVLSGDTLSESMIAVPGDNCDVWLLVHSHIHPVFKAYHITRKGIDTNPVISVTGGQIKGIAPNGTGAAYDIGSMCVSPNRKLISLTSISANGLDPALTISGILLCKFNSATGRVSDGILVGNQYVPSYQAAFSADNTKLYCTTIQARKPNGFLSLLKQYDITNYDANTIAVSEIIVDTMAGFATMIRLFRDTIYLAEGEDARMATIERPNLPGISCNYRPGSILLKGDHAASFLPNEVVYPLRTDTVYVQTDSLICKEWGGSIKLRPRSTELISDYEWDDGSTDSFRLIRANGTYWVRYRDFCHYKIDTFSIRGGDVSAKITADHFTLSTLKPYASYLWLYNGTVVSGATNRNYTVTHNGNYQVAVTNEHGCIDTSEVYPVNNYTGITDDIRALMKQIVVFPNPVQDMLFIQSPVPVNVSIKSMDGQFLLQAKNVKAVDVHSFAAGVYMLHLTTEVVTGLKVVKFTKFK